MAHSASTDQDVFPSVNTRDQILNLVIGNLPLILFMIDSKGIIRVSVGSIRENVLKSRINVQSQNIYERYADVPEVINNYERALQGETFSAFVNIGDIILHTIYSPLTDENGAITGVVGVSSDVTAELQVKRALLESELRVQVLIERAAIGVVLKTVQGNMFSCNPALQDMLGYSQDELVAFSYIDLTHPEDRIQSQRLFLELVTGERDRYVLEKRYRRKDGSYMWGRVTASLMPTNQGAARHVIAMIEDITQSRQLAQELAEVRRRLALSREVERLKLAHSIHNGPLQELIGITYQLRALENSPDAEYNKNQLRDIAASLDQLAGSLRNLSGELRPTTLEPFGLDKAIRTHAEATQEQHPEILMVLRLAEERLVLPDEARIGLFRIYQECLANIIRHANAKTVWVRLMLDDDAAVLEVQDDGVGFVQPVRRIELVRNGQMGLVGAMERAESLGGSLEIESKQNRGTLVRAMVPRTNASA